MFSSALGVAASKTEYANHVSMLGSVLSIESQFE